MEGAKFISIGIRGLVDESIYEELDSIIIKGESNTYYLFTDYSNYDIPVGTVFTAIKMGDNLYECNCTLIGVTQQYNKGIDEISKGWKTIISLKDEEGDLSVFANLDRVDDWYSSPVRLYLITSIPIETDS